MRRDVFQAIADPTRRAILSLIAIQAMTPNSLATNFHSTRQAVSKHLRILSECQLITSVQQGREIYYHFNPEKIKEVSDWALQFQQLWETRFNQLDQLLSNTKGTNDDTSNHL